MATVKLKKLEMKKLEKLARDFSDSAGLMWLGFVLALILTFVGAAGTWANHWTYSNSMERLTRSVVDQNELMIHGRAVTLALRVCADAVSTKVHTHCVGSIVLAELDGFDVCPAPKRTSVRLFE